MKALTGRQREVLSFITEYLKTNSFPPTVREIGEHFDISLRAVQDHLSALQKKEYISQRSKCSRSMKILKYADAKDDVIYSAKIPVIGKKPFPSLFVSSSLILSTLPFSLKSP